MFVLSSSFAAVPYAECIKRFIDCYKNCQIYASFRTRKSRINVAQHFRAFRQ